MRKRAQQPEVKRLSSNGGFAAQHRPLEVRVENSIPSRKYSDTLKNLPYYRVTHGYAKGFLKSLCNFHLVVGCCCSCPVAPLEGGISQDNVNNSFSMTICVTLYFKGGTLL